MYISHSNVSLASLRAVFEFFTCKCVLDSLIQSAFHYIIVSSHHSVFQLVLPAHPFIFNGRIQAIIQTGGVLDSIEPHMHKVLGDLCTAFNQNAKTFSVKQCANILSTMVLLGHFDTGLKDAIVDRVLDDVQTADTESLGSICYSLGVGGYFDLQFFKAMEKVRSSHKPFLKLAIT